MTSTTPTPPEGVEPPAFRGWREEARLAILHTHRRIASQNLEDDMAGAAMFAWLRGYVFNTHEDRSDRALADQVRGIADALAEIKAGGQ